MKIALIMRRHLTQKRTQNETQNTLGLAAFKHALLFFMEFRKIRKKNL